MEMISKFRIVKNTGIMAYNSIIGREEEIAKQERFLKSTKSEFVAVYGRSVLTT